MNRFDIAKKPIIIKEDQPEPESVSLPVAPVIPEPDGLAFFNFRRGDLSYEDFYKTFTEISKIDKVLSPICPSDLADLFAKVEGKNLSVDTILMNAKRFSDLRKWGRDVLDIEVNRTFLAQGLMGSIWGANIFITRKMPENLIMAISEEQHHIAAILEAGQERVYNLTGLGELMTDIRNQRKQLDGLYDSLEQMVLKSLTVIEQEKNGKAKYNMDYLKFREESNQSYGPYDPSEFKAVTGNDNLTILPCDSPLEGAFGFVIFTNTPEGEKSVYLQRKIWSEANTIQIKTRSEFDKIFSDAYTADYKIIPCDDPVKRLLGFIVLKNSSATRYCISLTAFKG